MPRSRSRTQRIKSNEVRVEGLVEVQKALKELGPDAAKESRQASLEVAKFVASDARSRAYSLGSTPAHVAPTIRPTAGAASAGVGFGGAANPEAGGAEFGSFRFKQFKPWRGNGPEAGYFIYPTIRQDADRIVETYEKRWDEIIKRRFPQ